MVIIAACAVIRARILAVTKATKSCVCIATICAVPKARTLLVFKDKEEIDELRDALEQRDPLTDDEIKCIKPVCADFVSFRAGVRQAEREHGIGSHDA